MSQDEAALAAAGEVMRRTRRSNGVRSAVKDCVHCGFCLPACPTYQLWGEEMDSPRGRIHLVSQLLDGAPLTAGRGRALRPVPGLHGVHDRLPVRGAVRPDHRGGPGVDRGRGNPLAAGPGPRGARRCRDDGVAGRGWLWRRRWRRGRRCRCRCRERCRGPLTAPRPLADRLTRAAIFALFPYPRRLRVAIAPLRLAQRTGADRLLARSGLRGQGVARRRAGTAARAALPADAARPAARSGWRRCGTRRAVVGMLTGCVQSVFFPGVNAATARVLAAEGCDVIIPRDRRAAAGRCRCTRAGGGGGRGSPAQTIETFEAAGVDVIVVNSAGCGSAMKEYERLFARLAADGGDERGRASPALPGQMEAAAAPGRRCCRRGSATCRSSWTSSGRSRRGTRCRCGRPTTTPAISGTRSGSPPRRAPCCARSPASTWSSCATPGSAAARRACTTCCSRTRRPRSVTRKADSVLASGAALLISANPGCTLQISAALAAAGVTIGPRTPPRSWTPRSTASASPDPPA